MKQSLVTYPKFWMFIRLLNYIFISYLSKYKHNNRHLKLGIITLKHI